MKEIQVFYDLLTIYIIISSSMGPDGKTLRAASSPIICRLAVIQWEVQQKLNFNGRTHTMKRRVRVVQSVCSGGKEVVTTATAMPWHWTQVWECRFSFRLVGLNGCWLLPQHREGGVGDLSRTRRLTPTQSRTGESSAMSRLSFVGQTNLAPARTRAKDVKQTEEGEEEEWKTV